MLHNKLPVKWYDETTGNFYRVKDLRGMSTKCNV